MFDNTILDFLNDITKEKWRAEEKSNWKLGEEKER